MNLHDLKNGQVAYITGITGGADHVQKLRELGFCDGSKIEMVRQGDPCIVLQDHTKTVMRFSNVQILVREE